MNERGAHAQLKISFDSWFRYNVASPTATIDICIADSMLSLVPEVVAVLTFRLIYSVNYQPLFFTVISWVAISFISLFNANIAMIVR